MTARSTDRGLRNRDPAPPLALRLRRTLVQTVENYRERGRKLAELEGAALRERFIAAFNAWVSGQPDGVSALNDAAAEFLLRRRPAPIDEIADQVSWVFVCCDSPIPDREPLVVIALGRWLFAPFMGALLVAKDEPDKAAQARDFDALMAAVRPRRVR